jgi:tetratricopeptide (TPR) repeat protein
MFRGWLTRALCAAPLLFVSSGVLSVCRLTFDSAQDGRAQVHAEEGLQFVQTGDLASADGELRRAVALAPGNAEFLRDLATVLAMEKKFDESTVYFQRSLRINPKDLLARRYLAANLWQLHRYAEARQNLRILLAAIPGDPEASLLLGMVSENTRDYATAMKMLASVPTLVRRQPESIAALARSYYHMGDTEKARAWIKELQNQPAGVQAILLGVQIADEMRDYEAAEMLLSSAAAQHSDRFDLQYQLALVKFHERHFEESRRTLQQLLDDGHKTSDIHRLLASCLLAQKHNEEAIHELEEAVRLDPDNEARYLDLASLLLGEKRISPAMQLAERMVKTFPNSSHVFISKGTIELRAGAYTDAVSSFTQATQLEPGNADATIGLARAQANAGMTEGAKTTLDNAIRSLPDKAHFELELAQLLLKDAETGDKSAEARAEQLLNSAIAHDSKLSDAHYELGDLALQRGEVSTALLHLQRAAKLDPSSAKTHFALSRAYRLLGRRDEAAKETALFERFKE